MDVILPPSYPVTHGRRAGKPFVARTPLGLLLSARGLTIADLAASTGLSRRTVEWISSGDASGQFGIRAARIAARHLNVSPSEILTPAQRTMLGMDREGQ